MKALLAGCALVVVGYVLPVPQAKAVIVEDTVHWCTVTTCLVTRCVTAVGDTVCNTGLYPRIPDWGPGYPEEP